MTRPVISLYGLEGLGLIVPYPSGVLYTNQTGGATLDAILHTPEEPFVVTPAFFLELDRARLADSMEAWLYVTITACPDEHMIAYAGHSDGTFSMVQTLSGQPWSPADQPELTQYVGLYPITGFGRRSAILTWPNSD